MSLRRAVLQDDVSSESSEDEAETQKQDDTARARAIEARNRKNSVDEELERLVFGGKAGFREHLFKNTVDAEADEDLAVDDLRHEELVLDKGTEYEELDDGALFTLDAADPIVSTSGAPKAAKTKDSEKAGDVPAWEDSDDERLTVSLATVSRLRKLRLTEGEDMVSGAEYSRRLRQQYLRLNPLPAWAQGAAERESKRRRRSSASSGSDSLSEADEDGEDLSALPLDKFLRDVNLMSGGGARKMRKLRPETIDIQRTRDIPDTHVAAVASLAFHPQYPVLLSSSTSSILYLHHIAPTAYPTPNPSLASVQAKQVSIRRAEFLQPNGDGIIFAGRRRFFHSWSLSTGLVKKVSQIEGHQQEHRTMERFKLSPCGRWMALVSSSRKGGGMLNITSMDTTQWAAQARLDGRGGIADFCWWSTGNGITILGKDGHVGEWSMETRRIVGIWKDQGSTGGTVLAMGGPGGPSALGEDRWVAIGSNSGILNIYDRNGIPEPPKTTDTEVKLRVTIEPTRALEQITTAITFISFSQDGQLMAFGSKFKKDAFKLVHLPSCTVYRNWPTEQTPLGRITAVTFGKESDLLAVGNDKGKIRLWEIRS